MSQNTMPDSVTPADQIGLAAREAQAAVRPRDAGSWAAKVDRLAVERRDGVRGTNVAGRRLTGPVQGFGKMWEKTYSLNAGSTVTPRDAIATWKAHFPEFWPKGNRFAGALAGISPGDVALLDLAIGGGVKLSTGVFVLYADEESFTLMTPQGHMFAGWITFSAERPAEATVIRAHVLMRANDPLYELGMTFGGHSKEDPLLGADADRAGHVPWCAGPAGRNAQHLRGQSQAMETCQKHLAQLDDPQPAANLLPWPAHPGLALTPHASVVRTQDFSSVLYATSQLSVCGTDDKSLVVRRQRSAVTLMW